MSLEGQRLDNKSLRVITGKNVDWPGLARDCVAFANAQGGRLLTGIEDGEAEPPAGQRVPAELVEKVRVRIGELTVNVTIAVQSRRSATTGGEYLEITVSRSASPASTTDGRFYLRVGDASKPLVGEDVQRLLGERNAQPWETLTTLAVPRSECDPALLGDFVAAIRASDRVKPSVKEKSDEELLDHYYLAIGTHLTNLGILCIGRREHRAQLGSAPLLQAVKYDELGNKINKWVWDDFSLSPVELVDAIWQTIPDFRESYEVAEGLFRRSVPAYDEKVIRELLVNALVHRPYTQRGDLFFNLHADRLEVVNPGRLPLGVTPQNILHASRRRNDALARLFHDLGLMEREGSGFDLMYDRLLSQGRAAPVLEEGSDWVKVTVQRRILKVAVLRLVAMADERYHLSQRERITLGALALSEGITARDLAARLDLEGGEALKPWLGRLLKWDVIGQAGKTAGTRYFVKPELLQQLDFPAKTSLARIEPHRLEALIVEDLKRYPGSAIGEINHRIGSEIKRRQIKLALDRLREAGAITCEGKNRWRRYSVSP